MTADRVREILADQLGVDESQLNDDAHLVNDLRADSLDAIEIIMELEDEFDICIPDDGWQELQTVKEVVAAVEGMLV